MTEELIHIVGPLKLQNVLMASFLEAETGAKCRVLDTLRDIETTDDGDTGRRSLVIWDCFGKDLPGSLFELESHSRDDGGAASLALFNVCPGLGVEPEAVARGVQGFFYEEDPLDHFAKGIRAILDGELWVTRKVMTESILRIQRQNGLPVACETVLTRREMEILTMVAEGSANRDIADKLFVSPHTVKTHLYNAFKKIGVPNRLQAALWAAKNL